MQCKLLRDWKHYFIYQKLTGSNITYICIFYCYAEVLLSISSYKCQNMVKKDLSLVSVNGSSGHLLELNATLWKSEHSTSAWKKALLFPTSDCYIILAFHQNKKKLLYLCKNEF